MLTANGVELSHRVRGEGVPLLCVHETATGGAAWEPLAEALGDRMRLVVYDRRGWGGSTSPQDYRRTTIEEQSEDAAALIDRLGGEPAVLCGAGLGAVVALDLLLRRPALALGAVIIEPPLLAFLPTATEALAEDRLALERALAEKGVEGAVELYLSGELTALGSGAERLPPELSAPARGRPATLFAELGAVAAWTMLARLASCERRSFAVVCSSTPPLVSQAAGALSERLAGCELRALGAGAAPPQISDPGAVAELSLELTRSSR
jgi:pimeloyl-ACP methyl ester carboxylesterase